MNEMEYKAYVLEVGTINPPPHTKTTFTLYARDPYFEVAEDHPALHCYDHRPNWRAYTVDPRWNAVKLEKELRTLLDERVILESGDFLYGVYPFHYADPESAADG
jgi:hypothetical protein